MKPVVSDPFIIGLFSGDKKTGKVGEYLQDFIAEVQFIKQHGIEIFGSDNKPNLHLSCFICDAPAHAYVRNIKGHNAYHGCDKCVQDGVWEGKVTFPLVNSPVGTDADFDEMKDEDHYLQAMLSTLCNLSLGMISQFPHDPMHLVYFGVVKCMLWSWTKGPVLNRCRIGANNVSQISECLLACHRYLPREFPRKCRSLLRIGNGHEKPCRGEDTILHPPEICLQSTASQLQDSFLLTAMPINVVIRYFGCVHDLMNVVYPDLDKHQLDKQYLCSRAILTPKNDSVDEINASLMDRYDYQQE